MPIVNYFNRDHDDHDDHDDSPLDSRFVSNMMRLSQAPDAVARNSTPTSQILFSQRFNALTNPKQVKQIKTNQNKDDNAN